MTKATEIPSKELIIQVAARALRGVHLDYQTFGVGYRANKVEDYKRLNHSAGVETALEPAAAAAFVQEFHSSKVAHGWLDPAQAGADPAPRFFRIEHEHAYRDAKDVDKNGNIKTKYVDAVIWRVDETGKVGTNGILPIEMKRARAYRKNLPDGERKVAAGNVGAVAADIEKLRDFREAWKSTRDARDEPLHEHAPEALAYPHVLVWGLVDKDEPFGDPHRFMTAAFKQANAKYEKESTSVEFLPLSWRGGMAAVEWMWVAYAEVTD